MEMNEVSKKVYEIIKDMICEEGKQVGKIEDDVVQLLDSIEFVSLIVEIETEFDIEINDADYELDKLNSIKKISELVIKYLGEK